MNTLARLLNILIRLCGAGALALGLVFWLGYARSLTQLHIGLGIGLVALLWVMAGVAWKSAAGSNALIAFVPAWGLVTWIFGVTQSQILRGSFHWIVEVAHLVIGGIAIAIGGQLASAVVSAARAPSTAGEVGREARVLEQ
jgi:hypothetical protein